MPIARDSCKLLRCAISPAPRTSPTWPFSWPATRAGRSRGSRYPSTPVATCRAEEASMVKLSIATPVVSLNPGAHGPWESTATIEDVARIAETADRLGYHHLTCGEHIALASASEPSRRNSTSSAPLMTTAAPAATRRDAGSTCVAVQVGTRLSRRVLRLRRHGGRPVRGSRQSDRAGTPGIFLRVLRTRPWCLAAPGQSGCRSRHRPAPRPGMPAIRAGRRQD